MNSKKNKFFLWASLPYGEKKGLKKVKKKAKKRVFLVDINI